MLQCPNHTCQTLNAETNRFCQACGVFLPKHYLWAIGAGVDRYQPGEFLANRYQCKAPRIFLDTQPGIVPDPFQELPVEFTPYLKLTPYRLHVPQLYEVIPNEDGEGSILLLEDAPLAIARPSDVADTIPDLRYTPSQDASVVELLPRLDQAWSEAIALRQLNWLWQLAQLWQPLQLQGMTSTLLTPPLLRVEGGLVRLLELQSDRTPVSLPELGVLWRSWLPSTQPALAPFLETLCQQLTQGTIHSSEQLLDRLDAALVMAGRSLSRQVALSTQTDQGPHRKRNEDACFPKSGTVQHFTLSEPSPSSPSAFPVVVVCDGIGGHQGGDVASGLAIASIQEHLQTLNPSAMGSTALGLSLEQAACIANDRIAQRNDHEQRHDRERMGTTLVMGLVTGHDLYVTHVGDSRAYRITHHGYHQVTLDDDIASREVRMGYSSFRQALQQPIGGSLVQALGMGPSSVLHPTVQRFILDEDCIFLMCSDGLSDFDRVDEYWDTTLLPVLQGKQSLAQVTKDLVTIANTRNGHDNVTIGLIHCTVQPHALPPIPAELAIADRETPPASMPTSAEDPQPSASAVKTVHVSPAPTPKPNWFAVILSVLVLVGLGIGISYALFPQRFHRWLGATRSPAGSQPTSDATALPDLTPSPSPSDPLVELTSNDILQVQQGGSDGAIALYRSRPSSSPAETTPGTGEASPTPSPPNQPDPALSNRDRPDIELLGSLPIGSVIQILQKSAATPGEVWVEVRICSTPTSTLEEAGESGPSATESDRSQLPPNPSDRSVGGEALPSPGETLDPLLSTGSQGWIAESELLPIVAKLTEPSPTQLGDCTPRRPSTVES